MLTIAISTVGINLERVCRKLTTYHFEENINVIVICQLFHFSKEDAIELVNNYDFGSKNLSFEFYNEVGISNSRNRAIQHCKSEYLWFVDDDVEFSLLDIKGLVSDLNENQPDLLFVKIRSLENIEEFYKDYSLFPKGVSENRLFLLKSSSIEIVVRHKFVVANDIRFNDRLGLGTLYPCCEENEFVLNIFDLKGSIFYSNFAPVLHTTLMDERLAISQKHYEARGYIASKFNFLLYWGLLIRWSLRTDVNTKLVDRFLLLLKGRKILK